MKKQKARWALWTATGMLAALFLVPLGRMLYLIYEQDPGLMGVLVFFLVYFVVMFVLMKYYEAHKYD